MPHQKNVNPAGNHTVLPRILSKRNHLQLPPIEPLGNPEPENSSAPVAIAPAWHTIVLVVAIIVLSIHNAGRLSAIHGSIDRLASYGFSAAMEVVMLAWVVLGLRLKRIPLRSLLGSFSFDARSIASDLGVALIFWFCSLMVLGTLGIAWSSVEAALVHRQTPAHVAGQSGQTGNAGQTGKAEKALARDPEQIERLRALSQLAPANGREIAAWTLLCLLVGFIEEIVFRGYLQRQFIGWARGGVVTGVLASAVVFGSAHAYQGVRGMVLLTVFGALFSMLALHRGSLRAGIFAHAWHDLIAGLALALLKSNHVI
jgi:membrane protease YdiL (CAAX protease family)